MAAWICLGDIDADYIPVSYGQPLPPIPKGAIVYILDFSYPRAVLEQIATTHQLFVLDHHATAEQELAGMPGCQFDLNSSGAVMAWRHFHPHTPVPEFFAYLQDRDLWRFKLPMSREVSMALRSYPMDFRGWMRLMSQMPRLMDEGVACRRLTDQQVDLMARNHGWAWFEFQITPARVSFHARDQRPCGPGLVIPCANATVFFSEVGERLLDLHPSADCAAYYLDRADGKRQWGLRSRPEFDASRLARAMGGGGHPQAAGFVTELK
jgi:hypothetical protein